MKVNISACFRTLDQESHFLFQVLNIGRSVDELKFVFTDPTSSVGGVYTPHRDRYSHEDIIRLVPEVSYHNDGSLFFKLPSYSARTSTLYRNPQGNQYRRTPLQQIRQWEGFLLYRVHNYALCKKKHIKNPRFLDIQPVWFDKTPFEVRFFLGSASCPTPIDSNKHLVQRFSQISNCVDLCLVFTKITDRGFLTRAGNTDEVVFSTNNIIEIIPHNPTGS